MDISRNRYNGGGRRAVAVFLIFIQVLIGVGSSLPNLVPVAEAAPTANINYQGKLTDTLGVAVSDGLYDMEFSLYSVPTGGSAIWTETRTGGSQVQVTNGLFSVMLGSVNTSLASVDFSQPLYLGVNIESDGEMSPRKILGTVPSAFESFNLGGVASSSFLRSDQDDTASGLVTFTGGLISNSSSSISDLFTTNLSINSEAFTDLTGSGLSNVGGALTVSTSSLDISLEGLTDVSTMTETLGDLLYWNGSAWADIATSSLNIALSDTTGTLADGRFDKSGNWSGTFDGEEGSWYQDLANSTGDTDDIAEGSSNLFSQWDNATGGLNYAGGNVGIGTTTPYAKLSVNGNIAFTGGIYDNAASLGANGMILQTNGTAVNWVSTSSMGINITADDITDDSIENLSDVTTMTKSFGDLLYWTGASWANLATSSLAINFSDLFGVADISTQTNLGVTATGLELSGNNVALTAGYNIPLSASTTNWNGFYNTPSSRITAGEALSWSGNSLNLNIDELSTDADFGSGDYFVYQDDGGNTYKVLYDNLPGAGGGITSLNGLTDATQGFATSTDTNITLSVNSSGSSHTFTPGWTGTLSAVRGGTGLGSVTQNQILIGGAGNTWTQVATSALNINTDNLTEGLTNLFYTDNRVASYINGSSTILSGNTESILESFLSDVSNVFTNNDGSLDDDNLADNDTDDLTEGSNLYYTDARVASYINGSTSISKLGQSIDISSETNLTVGNGITLTGDQLTVTGAGGLTQAAGGLTTTGVLQDLNTLGANTIADQFLVSTAAGTLAWESGATARTSLGVDAAGTDNSTNVTLAGTPNYLTLSGQQITLNKLDITDDTNATGGVGIDITANDFTLDLNELTTETSIATGDFISMVDITDNGSGKITYANFVGGNWTGTLDGIEGSAFALDSDIGTTIQGYNANTSILGSTINANELASEDFGDFTCNGTTCSLDAAYLTGNQTITLTGDVTGTGATSITTSIAADSIVEADLNADNGAVDGDFLQYDNTGGNFVWRDAGEVRSDLSLVVGTNVQAYDADLTTWAGISPSANAQSLVSAANYAAMRTLLDLEAGTDFYSIAAADAAFEGELNNEAGLYAALSDVTQFWEAGDTITSGVWQGTAIGDAYLTKTGDWTGTFDGQEGTYYLDNATHTGDVTGSGALAIANDVVAFGDIDYSLTLASNPGLLVDECYFAKTTSGGGFICEGSTADNNEQLYLLPDLNGADTTDTIATLGSTQTFTGVKTISSNWVNTANPWADNEVSDVLTVAGGTIGSNNISSASTWTTLGTLTIGDGGDRIDISSNTWDVTNGVITNATWNGAAIGDSYITKSGNWTGTFDGQEGSYYLANSFSTSSADYWETQQTSRSADDLSDDSIEALSDVASMSEITGDLLSWTGSAWSNVATSTLGLGNGTFLGLTDTPGSYTASAIPFVSGSALSFDSTFVYDGTNLGIGSSTPSSKLTIAGTEGSTDDIFNVASSSGYSYFSISSNGDLDVNNGAISYDSTNNQTSIANLLLGNVNFADDAGVVSWVDMNVTASSAVNTVLSYTASLDGNSLLTLYGKSDGSGGVTNLAVGIGTTTPSAKLTIAGTEGSTDDIFNVASSSGLSYLSISSDGNIDINNGAFYYDLALNKTSIERLDLGNVEFEQDAGWVSWIDLDVSASSTVGDVMAYSAQIDANELLTVYGEADGSGGIQNTRVFVGTTSSAVLGSSNIPDNSLIIGGGALCVDDNGGSNCDDAARTAGTIYAESSSVTAIDLAENYPTLDTSLEAGELVALAPKFQEVCTEVDENGEVRCTETDLSSVPLVEKADVTNSPTVLGIISTEPGVLLGGFGSSELAEFEKVPVALSGRVPVKVTDEAGVISPGDYVMLSDTMPGYAMKANKPGMAVGVALESFSPVDIKNEVSEGTDDSMETTVGVLEDNGFDVEKAVVGTKKKASSTSSSTNPVFVNTSQLILDDDKDTEVATGTIVVFVERTPLYITDFDFFSASSTIEVDEDSFWGRLAALAASFKDGVMSLMGLVIGSQEAPAGITIYDVVTGQPFCMYVANGQQVSREGSCDTLDLSDTTPVATSTPQDSGSGGNSSGGGNTGGGETIPDSISLSLNGQNPVSINIGDVYVDAGVTVNNASDESYGYLETVDGLAVGAINLDTSTTTQYEIGYEVLDTDGSHAVITRTVIVQEIPDNDGGDDTSTSTEEVNAPDTTAPVISLNGSASIELTVGDSYNENGATAVDETDGDLTGQINTSGAVNTNTAGSYTVTYEVSDMAGNSAQASRTVTVSPAPTAPAPLPTTSTATST